MPKQLALSASVSALFRDEGQKLLSVVRGVIQRETKQVDDFAASLDVKPSQMSSALNGNGYHFSLEWLPAALHVDRQHRILAHQASLVSCRVVENEMTDAEKVRRYEAALRRAGAAGEAIRLDALEEEA